MADQGRRRAASSTSATAPGRTSSASATQTASRHGWRSRSRTSSRRSSAARPSPPPTSRPRIRTSSTAIPTAARSRSTRTSSGGPSAAAGTPHACRPALAHRREHPPRPRARRRLRHPRRAAAARAARACAPREPCSRGRPAFLGVVPESVVPSGPPLAAGPPSRRPRGGDPEELACGRREPARKPSPGRAASPGDTAVPDVSPPLRQGRGPKGRADSDLPGLGCRAIAPSGHVPPSEAGTWRKRPGGRRRADVPSRSRDRDAIPLERFHTLDRNNVLRPYT